MATVLEGLPYATSRKKTEEEESTVPGSIRVRQEGGHGTGTPSVATNGGSYARCRMGSPTLSWVLGPRWEGRPQFSNRLLELVGFRLNKVKRPDRKYRTNFARELAEVRRQSGPYEVVAPVPLDDRGEHPRPFSQVECEFASKHFGNLGAAPQVLDVGSYREFLLGLMACMQVTTVDVRKRTAEHPNETVVTCDAKDIPLPDESFDGIVSLCAIEHFGLGRYGDEIDLDADRKAIGEMRRLLKPGGSLILSTTITGSAPAIAFNAHRIYTHELICDLFSGLMPVEEAFYARKLGQVHPIQSSHLINHELGDWDVYLGCWRK
jgi:SAM-dependent methyltransferase